MTSMKILCGCRLSHRQKELVSIFNPAQTQRVRFPKGMGNTLFLLSEQGTGTMPHAASPRVHADLFCSQCNLRARQSGDENKISAHGCCLNAKHVQVDLPWKLKTAPQPCKHFPDCFIKYRLLSLEASPGSLFVAFSISMSTQSKHQIVSVTRKQLRHYQIKNTSKEALKLHLLTGHHFNLNKSEQF